MLRLLNELTDEQEDQFYSLSDCKVGHGEEATEMGIWRTNNFALGRSHSKCSNGIFPKLSRFNHSCVPNSEFRWNDKLNRQEIRAIRSIEIGQEICLCYFTTSVLSSCKAERQEYLESRYGFVCDCEACRLSGIESQIDDNRRLEVRCLGKEIDDLIYEWVDVENDSEDNVEQPESESDDYSRALSLAKRRLSLMEQLGFKAISLLDACVSIVGIAEDLGDSESGKKFAEKGRSLAKMLYGIGTSEIRQWDNALKKFSS